MEEETSTPPAGTPAPPVAASDQPGSPPAGAGSVANGNRVLPSVAEILTKRAAGQKLTRAEAGRLSQVGRAARRLVESPLAAPPARRLAVATGVEDSGLALQPPAPPVDVDLCKNVSGEMLDTLNEAGLSHITAKAEAIDATPSDVERFRTMAALKPAGRSAIVNTSPSWLPKLLRIAGLDPNNAPDAMAGVAALLWGMGFLRASNSLGKLAKERKAAQRTEDSKSGPSTP